MSKPRVSPDINRFMGLFSQLKKRVDDLPETMAELAKADSGLKKLCIGVYFAANNIKEKERWNRKIFDTPECADYPLAWRDYQSRYHKIVFEMGVGDVLALFKPALPSSKPGANNVWKIADLEGRERAASTRAAIDFYEHNIEMLDRLFDQEEHAERIIAGIENWERLRGNIGLDLRRVFRRRALVPFVLIPPKVANREDNPARLSMLQSLQQANDAFIFGSDYAAIALMRSIMEVVLREYYRFSGDDLYELICNSNNLPNGVNKTKLHRLRKLGNYIMHFNKKHGAKFEKMNEAQLEQVVLSHFYMLRSLIEGVK